MRYRTSNAGWVDQLPEHWDEARLRFVATINPSKNEMAHLPMTDEVTFLPMEAVGEDGNIDVSRAKPIAEVAAGYTYFRNGDVLVAKITPCFENGKAALVDGLLGGYGFGSTEFHVLRAGQQLNREFLSHLVRSRPFRMLGTASMYGAGGQKRVPTDFVQNFVVPLPPMSEQTSIAEFLDRETARLDALIAAQVEFVLRVDERQRVSVNDLITKGTDLLAPVSATGNDLVPLIPSHWRLVRLRHVATVQHGLALGKKTDEPTTEVPYIRVANVQDGYLDLEYIKTVAVTAEQARRHALRPGDVLMNEGGDNDKLGRGAIWTGQIEGCIHQNHVFAVRPHGIEAEWLTLVAGCDYAKRFFETRAKQSTNLASISSTNLREVPIVLPPPAERAAILNSILIQASKAANLRRNSLRAVELFRERRSALITAALIGQINVTGPALTEAAD